VGTELLKVAGAPIVPACKPAAILLFVPFLSLLTPVLSHVYALIEPLPSSGQCLSYYVIFQALENEAKTSDNGFFLM
jgi:hypothetical protein